MLQFGDGSLLFISLLCFGFCRGIGRVDGACIHLFASSLLAPPFASRREQNTSPLAERGNQRVRTRARARARITHQTHPSKTKKENSRRFDCIFSFSLSPPIRCANKGKEDSTSEE
ncbi:hypothetical protein BKA80DRAFT_262856 [Phyllosticta citrichinensis]